MVNLDSMAIELFGMDTGYQAMLAKAQNDTTNAMNKIDSSIVKTMENIGSKLTSIGTTLSVAITAPLTAAAGFAVAAFNEEENATRKLSAALTANGKDVATLLPDYVSFAAEMQKLTVVGDETTIAMLQQAESFGATGENAKRAVTNAIAMQSAFGVDAENAIRLTAALEKGHAEMLKRYIPALKGIHSESEMAAKAQDILTKSFNVSKEEAQSGTGQIKQFMNTYGDLQEMFGKIIMDGLTPLIGWLKEGVVWLQNLDDVTKKWIVWLGLGAAAIGPILVAMGTLATVMAPVVGALMVIGPLLLAWAPFVLTIGAIVAGVALLTQWLVGTNGLVGAWNTATSFAAGFFTAVMGFFVNFQHNMTAIWTWFTNNWLNIFTDIGGLVVAFVSNMISNFQTMLFTIVRLGAAFSGWMAGLWERVFSIDFTMWIANGAIEFVKIVKEMIGRVSNMILGFATQIAMWIANALQGKGPAAGQAVDFMVGISSEANKAITTLTKDAIQGALDPNFFNTAGKIIDEGLGQLKKPFDGFVSSITDAPDLLLGFDFNLGKASDEAGKGIGNFDGLARSMEKIKGAGKGIEATQAGTTEALARLIDFQNLRVPAVIAKAPVAPAKMAPIDPKTIAADAKMIAAIEPANVDQTKADESMTALLAQSVEQLKIGNDLQRDKMEIILEPVNL